MSDLPYRDDVSISDDANLWRRIHPDWVVTDENRGGVRPSSAAFDDSDDGTPLSVVIEEAVLASGRDAAKILENYAGYSLAAFTAGAARANGQGVARTPTPEEPAHGSVFGKKTKSVKRRLSHASSWVIAPA